VYSARASNPMALLPDVRKCRVVLALNTVLRYAIENASRDLAVDHDSLRRSLLRYFQC